MKRAIVQQPQAGRDLRMIVNQIARASPQSADRFIRAAERTFALLAERPGVGARNKSDDPRLADVRVCRVTRFRSYLIFYRATDDRLEILRVLHAARDVDGILAETFNAPGGLE